MIIKAFFIIHIWARESLKRIPKLPILSLWLLLQLCTTYDQNNIYMFWGCCRKLNFHLYFFFLSCTSTILQSNHHQSKFSIVINTNVTFTVNDPVLHPAVCAKYRQLLPTEIWLLDLSPNFCRTVKCHWCIIPLLTYYLVVVFSVCLCRVLSVTLWRGFHVEKSKTVDRSDREVYRERFAQRKVFFGYSHLQTASRDITSKKKKVIGFP